MRWLVLLGLWACSSGPTVETVDPMKAETGTTLTVFGTGFSESSQLMLESAAGQRTAMENIQPGGSVVIKGDIPTHLETGTYGLVLVSGGQEVIAAGLAITAPPPDVPCGGNYTANTQVSWARKLIVVDRFYKDGDREVLRTPFDEVEKVEIESVPHEKGTCSVVYVRKKDGSRMRYAESLSEDLSARAYKFANELKKPVDVVKSEAVPK